MKVSGTTVLTMNPMRQTAVITSRKAGESSWNNLFYAHPHGPLPRGEGETLPASLKIHAAVLSKTFSISNEVLQHGGESLQMFTCVFLSLIHISEPTRLGMI